MNALELICLEKVSKRFSETLAVDQVAFSVPTGALVALLGPSGCGKTTILRLIAGLERPASGSIWLAGRQVAGDALWVAPELRRIGMVFQDGALFPHLTVAQNIAFSLSSFGAPQRAIRQRIAELLDLIGLAGLDARYPHQLSGGQQQRVALARALAPRPAIVLLDEPFSRLDAALRLTLREEVRQIVKQAGATTVFVTHDQEEALSSADQVVVLFAGRVAQVGVAEQIYTHPASHQVAAFVGEANFLPGNAYGATVACGLGELPLTKPQQGAVEVMIRPEAIELLPTANGAARIERIRYFGHDQLLSVVLHNGDQLNVRSTPHPALAVGTPVDLRVRGSVMAYPC